MTKMRGKRQDAVDQQAVFDNMMIEAFPNEFQGEVVTSSNKRPRENEDDNKARKKGAGEESKVSFFIVFFFWVIKYSSNQTPFTF